MAFYNLVIKSGGFKASVGKFSSRQRAMLHGQTGLPCHFFNAGVRLCLICEAAKHYLSTARKCTYNGAPDVGLHQMLQTGLSSGSLASRLSRAFRLGRATAQHWDMCFASRRFNPLPASPGWSGKDWGGCWQTA